MLMALKVSKFFASSFILYLEGALAYYTEIFALIFFNFSEIFLP